MVFSEASHRPEVEFMKNLEAQNALPENLKSIFHTEIDKLDSDRIFGEVIARIKDGYILGSFFSGDYHFTGQEAGWGYVAACNQLVFIQ